MQAHIRERTPQDWCFVMPKTTRSDILLAMSLWGTSVEMPVPWSKIPIKLVATCLLINWGKKETR